MFESFEFAILSVICFSVWLDDRLCHKREGAPIAADDLCPKHVMQIRRDAVSIIYDDTLLTVIRAGREYAHSIHGDHEVSIHRRPLAIAWPYQVFDHPGRHGAQLSVIDSS